MASTPQEQTCAKTTGTYKNQQTTTWTTTTQRRWHTLHNRHSAQIKQQPYQEQKTPEKGKETHKFPTCHYEGEQEHHLTRHRRKNKMQTTMGTGTKQGWKRQNANMQRSLQNKTRTRKTQSLPQSWRTRQQKLHHQSRNNKTRQKETTTGRHTPREHTPIQ